MRPNSSDSSTVLIYYEDQDQCWIAHHIEMDQIGTGDCIVDAMADLNRAVEAVVAMAVKDRAINLSRRAPSEVCEAAERATQCAAAVDAAIHGSDSSHLAHRPDVRRW